MTGRPADPRLDADLAAYKTCSRCGESKPLDRFYSDKRRPGGVAAICKDCRGVTINKWRAANKERIRETDPAFEPYRAALALVQTALEAAEETRDYLRTIQVQAEDDHPIFGIYQRLDSSVRAVREGK